MGRTAVAFCPGHISGYFCPVFAADPARSGSLGAGIVISDGVRAVVEQSPTTSIDVCGAGGVLLARESPPISYALEKLGYTARVRTSCTLPIGAGFGLSAAALLATITAIDEIYTLGLRRTEIAALAHESEVVHRTGLGDVAACMGGGLVTRRGPGITAAITRDLTIRERFAAISFGPLPTPEMLGSEPTMHRVQQAFPHRCPDTIGDFFDLSRSFAEESGLITDEVHGVLNACDRNGVPASMTMLGRGVFAMGNRAQSVLGPFGKTYTFGIAAHGFARENP
jgi:pantoate kinase